MSAAPKLSSRITRIYFIGVCCFIAFYVGTFHVGILLTENTIIERRLNAVATHHFEQFKQSDQHVLEVDPLLTIYQSYDALPQAIQAQVPDAWTGTMQVFLEDEREFQVVAKTLVKNDKLVYVYAVENSDAVEWNDVNFIITEISIILVGVGLLIVIALLMFRALKYATRPLTDISRQLESAKSCDFTFLQPTGERTQESIQIVNAINVYREKIAEQIEREKSFTRYISHELRTPMMIIHGALSNLKKYNAKQTEKPVSLIAKAVGQMQEMTHTFLLLAREQASNQNSSVIDQAMLKDIEVGLIHNIENNNIQYRWELDNQISVNAEPLLIRSIITNLLKNAFACTEDGKVKMVVNKYMIKVVDNGCGLDRKPRGYDGFGVGLVLINDICKKYGWSFSLQNNNDQGCTAMVTF